MERAGGKRSTSKVESSSGVSGDAAALRERAASRPEPPCCGSRPSKFSDDMPLALLSPKPDTLIMTQKELVLDVVNELPEEASLEEIAQRIEFLAAIQKGIDQLDRGEGIPHEEVKRQLATWLAR